MKTLAIGAFVGCLALALLTACGAVAPAGTGTAAAPIAATPAPTKVTHIYQFVNAPSADPSVINIPVYVVTDDPAVIATVWKQPQGTIVTEIAALPARAVAGKTTTTVTGTTTFYLVR
jgi:hypothetical protein